MKNENGIDFAAFYGDINIAAYPNPAIFGPTGGNRSETFLNNPAAKSDLIAGLLMPGGPRAGKVYK